MNKKDILEGLGELADIAERDHEVQMARAELYKLAKYAIKLHDMLKGVSEAEGLEGWVQSKITKSADMIGSVYHHMDYEDSPMADNVLKGQVSESKKDTHCSDKCCGSDVKREDCKCAPTCKHCNCNDPKVDESLALKLENVQQQRKDDMFKSMSDAGAYSGKSDGKQNKKSKPVKRSQADKDAGVAKMRDEDEAAKKSQRDRFAAIKKSADKKATTEGKSPHKKGTEKYKKHMAAMHASTELPRKKKTYKESLGDKLAAAALHEEQPDIMVAIKNAVRELKRIDPKGSINNGDVKQAKEMARQGNMSGAADIIIKGFTGPENQVQDVFNDFNDFMKSPQTDQEKDDEMWTDVDDDKAKSRIGQ